MRLIEQETMCGALRRIAYVAKGGGDCFILLVPTMKRGCTQLFNLRSSMDETNKETLKFREV